MRLTLSIDRNVAELARAEARRLGLTLDNMVSRYLHEFAAGNDAARDNLELRRLSLEGGGRSRSWRFDRDEAHTRD